jgi:L-asparaginase/Glu-tRNA(Gln) amidotransferase subunit D
VDVMSSRNLMLLSRDEQLLRTSRAASPLPTSESDARAERRVLVLYVGGTIGMTHTPASGWVPCKGLLTKLLVGNSKFHDAGHADGTMPLSQWGKRVVWTLMERDVLLDSSDMDHTDWEWIATQIQAYYENYDGFVLIQGTDTLTYTSSALSFMLRFLRKTVIVTGSQVW